MLYYYSDNNLLQCYGIVSICPVSLAVAIIDNEFKFTGMNIISLY